MKEALFFSFLAVFLATAIITLLGITGRIKVKRGYLRLLVGALLLELVGSVVGLYRATDWFADASSHPAEVNERSDTPFRVLLTSPFLEHVTQRRFQVLIVENGREQPLRDLRAKISCARTVDVSEVLTKDINGTTRSKRTPEAIFVESELIPVGASVVLA